MTTFYCLRFVTSQPGGPGPRIYIPQEQGGPVIPTGTGFPFRRLLRLARLRWRYSIPPPHGIELFSGSYLAGRLYSVAVSEEMFVACSYLWRRLWIPQQRDVFQEPTNFLLVSMDTPVVSTATSWFVFKNRISADTFPRNGLHVCTNISEERAASVIWFDDGGSRFFQNISNDLPDYTVSHPKRR
jgi:hypothetical protein